MVGTRTHDAGRRQPARPGAVDGVFHAGTIWTLTFGKHTAQAEVWAVPGVGMDLRYFIDGALPPPSCIAV